MYYQVKNGETIYDVAINTYGVIELIYKILLDNPAIESIDYDLNSLSDPNIFWDETFIVPTVSEVDLVSPTDSNPERTILATSGQSLYDICLMTYGDLKYFTKLLTDNNIVSPNSTNINGKIFKFNSNLINDSGFYSYLKNQKKVIATVEGATPGKSYNNSYNISFN